MLLTRRLQSSSFRQLARFFTGQKLQDDRYPCKSYQNLWYTLYTSSFICSSNAYKSEVTANRQNIKLRNQAKQKVTLNEFHFTPIHPTQQRRHGNPEILALETYCLWTDIWWSVNKVFQSIWNQGACSIKPQHRRTNVCCRVTISRADYTRCGRQGTRHGNIIDASARTCRCEHTNRNIGKWSTLFNNNWEVSRKMAHSSDRK